MDNNTIACEACGAKYRWKPELVGKKIKCKCGALVTVPGPAMATAAAAPSSALPSPASMYADRMPRKYSPPVEEKSSRLGMIIGIVAVIIVAGVSVVFLGRSTASKFPPPLAGDDAGIVETLNDDGGMEVRAWLKQDEGRLFVGMTRSQGSRYIDDLYALGAKNIYASGSRMAMHVYVELPTEAEKRKPFFDWYKTHGGALVKDIGQRYETIGMQHY